MKTQVSLDLDEVLEIRDALKCEKGARAGDCLPGCTGNDVWESWMDRLIARFERAQQRLEAR